MEIKNASYRQKKAGGEIWSHGRKHINEMKYLDIKTKTNFNVLIFLKCFSLDVPVFLFTIFRFFPFPINPPGLGDAYEQGLVKAVGVSNYGSDALRACHAKLASRGIPLVSNQVTLDLQDDLVE